MTELPFVLTRLGKVCVVLKSRGPMTAKQIAMHTRMTPTHVRDVIKASREANVKNTVVRCVGYVKEGKFALSRKYELSNLPDIAQVKRIQKRRFDREEDFKRVAELKAQIQPFRDPMLFLTAGRAP